MATPVPPAVIVHRCNSLLLFLTSDRCLEGGRDRNGAPDDFVFTSCQMQFAECRWKGKVKQTERPTILFMVILYSRLMSSERCLEGGRDRNGAPDDIVFTSCWMLLALAGLLAGWLAGKPRMQVLHPGFLAGWLACCRTNRQSPLSRLGAAFGVVFAFRFRNLLNLQTFAFQFAFRIYKPSHLTVN